MRLQVNEKIKKIFLDIGIFLGGVLTAIACFCLDRICNNRARTSTVGKEQSTVDNAHSDIDNTIGELETTSREIELAVEDFGITKGHITDIVESNNRILKAIREREQNSH